MPFYNQEEIEKAREVDSVTNFLGLRLKGSGVV